MNQQMPIADALAFAAQAFSDLHATLPVSAKPAFQGFAQHAYAALEAAGKPAPAAPSIPEPQV